MPLKPKFWDKKQFSIISYLLLPVSYLYLCFFLFKKKITKEHLSSIPILCVGNIYLGGMGKTSVCIELSLILKNLGKKSCFIQKNYDFLVDENKLLSKIAPVFSSSKRLEAIKSAQKEQFDVAIMDDGFQDFSIKKNFSFLCFGEKQWIGNGRLIPAGPLRESLKEGIDRSNCILIKGKKNNLIENEIGKINNTIDIFYFDYESINIKNYLNNPIIAFAGIGDPGNFFELLKKNNINTVANFSFPDHHNYSDDEINRLIDKAKENNAILLTTEKDFLRIKEEFHDKISFLEIKLIIQEKNKLVDKIKKLI